MGNCISPLRRAIRKRDAAQVEKLLKDAGESAPDYINEDYTADCFCTCMQPNTMSPLHTAINRQLWDIVWILLDYGADPEGQSGFWQQTPLHLACRLNDLKLTKHLAENFNVNFHSQDYNGTYPIHCCCSSAHAIFANDVSILEYFKQIGKLEQCDLKLQNGLGDTPLHVAVRSSNSKAVEYLRGNGADSVLEVTNHNGQTALDLCNNEAIRKLLIKY